MELESTIQQIIDRNNYLEKQNAIMTTKVQELLRSEAALRVELERAKQKLGEQTKSRESEMTDLQSFQRSIIEDLGENPKEAIATLKSQKKQLEDEVMVLQTEYDTVSECNSKYVEERTQLSEAISSLRGALGQMKAKLEESERERTELLSKLSVY